MRRFGIVLIVAGMSMGLAGCKADRATQESSTVASQPGDLPREDTSVPAAAPPAAVASPQDHLDKRPLIVCFGDSLTAGYGTEAGQTYPDYLQADLDSRGYKYRVVNAGISGNTTKDGVERVNDVVAMKPALVVVEFGGNDGLRGLRIEDSRANLDRIIATLKASGTKVVLAGITLPPDYGPDYIKQFNETYTLLAKKYHVPMLPFLLNGVFGVDGMMQRDRTHATAKGNKVVANNVLPLILPLLKK
jgi:acyl-CoA thioesterase-1